MKIEELKQGQAVWVKGYVDRSVFGELYGFINFYKKDGNNLGHISKNNAREMKEEDVQIDQPKPVVQKFMADWYEEHNQVKEGNVIKATFGAVSRWFEVEKVVVKKKSEKGVGK